MTDLSRSEVFRLYEQEVHAVATEVAEFMGDKDDYNAMDGREWCEENDIPESVFARAVEEYVNGVTWGVSPMYPFRGEDEVSVLEVGEEDEMDEEEKEIVDEMEEAGEDDGE